MAAGLRRWTANPLCSARVGSNPILVEFFASVDEKYQIIANTQCIFVLLRQTRRQITDRNRLAFEKWNYSRDFLPKYVIFGINGKLKNKSNFCWKNSVRFHSLEPQFLRHKIAQIWLTLLSLAGFRTTNEQ